MPLASLLITGTLLAVLAAAAIRLHIQEGRLRRRGVDPDQFAITLHTRR